MSIKIPNETRIQSNRVYPIMVDWLCHAPSGNLINPPSYIYANEIGQLMSYLNDVWCSRLIGGRYLCLDFEMKGNLQAQIQWFEDHSLKPSLLHFDYHHLITVTFLTCPLSVLLSWSPWNQMCEHEPHSWTGTADCIHSFENKFIITLLAICSHNNHRQSIDTIRWLCELVAQYFFFVVYNICDDRSTIDLLFRCSFFCWFMVIFMFMFISFLRLWKYQLFWEVFHYFR